MRGYAAIGLFAPKCDANVGGVMRASMCYGASMVAIQGQRYQRKEGAKRTDTTAAYRHIPVLHGQLRELIPHACVPVAVEFSDSAKCLARYTHPQQAFYIFGPEDGNVPNEVLAWCRDIVKVPTSYCMNLAATVNVVLYDRIAKQLRIPCAGTPLSPPAKQATPTADPLGGDCGVVPVSALDTGPLEPDDEPDHCAIVRALTAHENY